MERGHCEMSQVTNGKDKTDGRRILNLFIKLKFFHNSNDKSHHSNAYSYIRLGERSCLEP